MGCQSEVTLGDYLTFSVCTHDPDTGELTDADAAPTYRVYEDETATAILTGTMATLDTANTTGFYSERIACTAANGFENDKTYTVYISATVDGDTGGICYGFLCRTIPTDVWAAATRTLTQSAASVISAVTGSTVTQYRATSWSFSLTGLGSLAARTKLYFTLKQATTDTDAQAVAQIEETAGLVYVNGAAATTATNGTLTVTDEATGAITITLADDETAALETADAIYYDVKMLTAAGGSQVMTIGRFNIADLVTESIT
jgi:hypothetical protein